MNLPFPLQLLPNISCFSHASFPSYPINNYFSRSNFEKYSSFFTPFRWQRQSCVSFYLMINAIWERFWCAVCDLLETDDSSYFLWQYLSPERKILLTFSHARSWSSQVGLLASLYFCANIEQKERKQRKICVRREKKTLELKKEAHKKIDLRTQIEKRH